MKKLYKVGIYCRLSVDDTSNSAKTKNYIPADESVSIENQYELLSKFVMLNGWTEVKSYRDDGYSGGNFQRPGFLEMLEDARHGLINLILVKDLSRLGRDFVEVGKTVGVVGESGCGKSVTSLSLMQLLQRPQGQVVEGEIRLNLGDKAYDITKTPNEKMQALRGNYVSMIFQEPMTSLNPVFRIGAQIDEVIELHEGAHKTKEEVKARTIEMLETVGIANSEGVYMMYPHELSGGMRQRVMIAMALACNPKIIIADEPTTALDVTIQAQILDLLRQLKDKINSSIMLITHDLGVIAEMADYVVVMYAGRIVEKGTAEEIFAHPCHPYTIGLMASKPVVGKKVDKLYSIPGKVPNPVDMPDYCYFKDRCEMQLDCCKGEYPCEISVSPTHKVSCYRYYAENRKAGE